MKKSAKFQPKKVLPQKRKPVEEEEESEEEERDEFDDEELDTAFGLSDDEGPEQVVDFDDGEVSLNLPPSVKTVTKKNLFDDDDDKNQGKVKKMNMSWLKPKDQEGMDGEESDDSAGEYDEENARLEAIAARKKQKKLELERIAKEDFEEQIKAQQKQIIEGKEDEDMEGKEGEESEEGEEGEESEEGEEEEDLQDVADRMANMHEKIQISVGILSDWSERRPANVSRDEFVEKLKEDIITYFGYTRFLVDLYFHLFTPAEALSHIESNETPRPLTIRVNSLKSTRRGLAQILINKGVTLEPIKWSKVGLVIYETKTIPIGATPEYLSGHYMLQSAASFLPVMALDPQPDESVLDMCAAPGGKTTYIAALMKNTGFLQANDKNPSRIPSLVANMHRMGVRNAMVTEKDGVTIPEQAFKFDRILVDAPCMGLGVIAKDRSIKSSKEEKDMQVCIGLQLKLLLAAIDSVDVSKAAIIVYSTCSISVEENEAIVDKALKMRHVKVLDSGLPFGVEGITSYRGKQFHPSLKMSRRYYPHAHNIDGFFVCKLHKYGKGPKNPHLQEPEVEAPVEVQPPVTQKATQKATQKKTPEKQKKKLIFDDPDKEAIDLEKVEKKTAKNKQKKANKRARQLARRRGEGGDSSDEDEAPAPAPKQKPAKTEQPPAKPAKSPAKTEKSPAKAEKPSAKTEKPPAKTEKSPAKTEKAAPKANGNGKAANGKGEPPQKRLRGSKQ